MLQEIFSAALLDAAPSLARLAPASTRAAGELLPALLHLGAAHARPREMLTVLLELMSGHVRYGCSRPAS